MVGHGGSSAGLYLADPTSPIPSHCASIVTTSTLRVNIMWCVSGEWCPELITRIHNHRECGRDVIKWVNIAVTVHNASSLV